MLKLIRSFQAAVPPSELGEQSRALTPANTAAPSPVRLSEAPRRPGSWTDATTKLLNRLAEVDQAPILNTLPPSMPAPTAPRK